MSVDVMSIGVMDWLTLWLPYGTVPEDVLYGLLRSRGAAGASWGVGAIMFIEFGICGNSAT